MDTLDVLLIRLEHLVVDGVFLPRLFSARGLRRLDDFLLVDVRRRHRLPDKLVDIQPSEHIGGGCGRY